MQHLYIELIFIDNFLLDFLLLLLSCRICEKHARALQLCIGASIGGTYSTIALYMPILTAAPCKIVIAALMCLPAGLIPLRVFFRRLLCFYCVAFLFGGILLSLMLEYGIAPFGQAEAGMPFRIVLLGISVLLLLTECLSKRYNPEVRRRYTLQFTLYGQTIQLQAICDTGNTLCDAMGNGVIAIDRYRLQKCISHEAYQKLLDPARAEIPVRRFLCRTAAGNTELYGFMPAQLILSDKRHNYTAKAYLALGDISPGQDVYALLPAGLQLYPLSTSKEAPHV